MDDNLAEAFSEFTLFSPQQSKECSPCATGDSPPPPVPALRKFVRLPCGKCSSVLPGFTVTWAPNEYCAVVREVRCRDCNTRQRVTIEPSVRPPPAPGSTPEALSETDLTKTAKGYCTSGVASLDWVKQDPTSQMSC